MNKELLTSILEACTEFQTFLTVDLSGENLATRVETKRQRMVLTTNDIINKIRSSHISVRPQPTTPNAVNGQTHPPGGEQMYIECGEGQPVPEDYLTFQSTGSPDPAQDNPQGMYEAMTTDDPQDTYDEPVQGVVSPHTPAHLQDGQQQMYEEPVTSPIPPNVTPTPPPSAENSGSGAVYARTNIVPGGAVPSETSTEWIYDTTRNKDEKMKVSQLENVTCKGNLEKLGGKNKKNWQVRFCVLSGPFMYFYEKESSKTYRNRITIPMYMAEDAPEHTNAKKKHFAFKLTHTDSSGKKKDYIFRSTKKESCETWLRSIRAVNDRAVNKDAQHIAMTPAPVAGGETPSNQIVDEQLEMYEPVEPIEEMTLSEEDQEEYVDVQPQEDDVEEYIDVDPSQLEQDEIQEEYEDTTQFQAASPAPPTPSHPPVPPSHPPVPPPHHTDPPIDISKIYMVAPNGIDLRNVYVALWDFVGSEKDELSVQRGDLIHVANPDPSAEWWAGEGVDADAATKTGKVGFLPATYFMPAFEEVA